MLKHYATDEQKLPVLDHIKRIVPKALDVIENKLDSKDAEFGDAMRFIEYAVPQETIAPQMKSVPMWEVKRKFQVRCLVYRYPQG